MFVLIILKHLAKFASFRMEYCDTLRGVYATTGYSQVDMFCRIGAVKCMLPHDHTS